MDNKEIVRLCFEKGCVEHDMDAAYELISEDYILHDPTNPDFPGGREAHKEMCKSFSEAMRDTSCSIEDQSRGG